MANKKKHLEKNVEKGLNTKVNKTFIILFVVLVILILAIAFLPRIIPESWFAQEEIGYLYNGFKIEKAGNFWIIDIQRLGTNNIYSVEFHNDPKSIESITTTIDGDASINNIYRYTKTYITFNPDDKNMSYVAMSASALSTNFAQVVDITPIAACSKDINNSACEGRRIINCDSVNAGEYAIYLNEANETSIHISENCVQINGYGKEMLKATEKYLYNLYGII